jgi:peptide/nickel transport system substrate-binding protein
MAALLAACGSDDKDATSTAGTSGAGTTPTSASGASGGSTPAASATTGSAGSPTTGSPSTGGSTGAVPEVPGHGRGKADLLRILFWQAPTNLNTHFSQGDKDSDPSCLVLEPLLNVDINGTLMPTLAAEVPSLENGGVAADGMSVTYKLRQGVTWSDGEPFTANDVKFTWQFATNPDTAATTFATYSPISDVEVVDDHTVTLKFAHPNPAWFTPFATGFGGQVLPEHILKDFTGAKAAQAPFNLKPIGTGAYIVTDFKPGDVIIFEPNEKFRDPEKPYFKQIEWKGGGDATAAATAALQTNETDFGWNLQVEKQVLDTMRNSDTGVLLVTPGVSDEQLLLNFADPNTEVDGAKSEPTTQHPYFSDKQVRQAFALACDRDTIATQLYGDAGAATANILVGPGKFVSPNTSYKFDVEAAKALLDQAGWVMDGDVRKKDGKSMNVLFQTTVNPLRQKEQEILKAAWTQMGAKVELKSIDAGVFFSSDAGNPDTAGHFYADIEMYTTGPASPYPVDFLEAFKSDKPETDLAQKSNSWAGANYNRWVNEDFNKLYNEALTELDPDKQVPLFVGMNDLIVNEVVRIALVQRAGVDGANKKLKGNNPSPWEPSTYDTRDWYFEE